MKKLWVRSPYILYLYIVSDRAKGKISPDIGSYFRAYKFTKYFLCKHWWFIIFFLFLISQIFKTKFLKAPMKKLSKFSWFYWKPLWPKLTGFLKPLKILSRNLWKIVNTSGFRKLSNMGTTGFLNFICDCTSNSLDLQTSSFQESSHN